VIPLKDENPTSSPAVLTILLIAACIVVYFFVQPGGKSVIRHSQSSQITQEQDTEFTFQHAAIPCELIHDHPLTAGELQEDRCNTPDDPRPLFPGKNVYLAILYSMFLHGSLLHIGGNMLFLWIFGNNIEDRFGKPLYLVFYVLAGVVATFAQVALSPSSVVPMIGASGAIAGVMGAYLVLYPRAPINSLILIPPIVLFRKIAARWLLLFWLASQFFLSPGSDVAWMAHVGGFVFGMLVGFVWRAGTRPERVVPSYS
jgi:membrane associated rhomboid family serine protease